MTKINLPKVYSQLDPLWKNKTYGAGATIGDYGCLLTCVAMASCYFGYEETPETLAQKVAFSGNLWIWNELTKLYPDITYQGMTKTPSQLTVAQMDKIRETINAGYPVFLQIDVIPSTSELNEHWVLAVDYDGDDFMIANPLTGTIHRITDYGIKPQLLIWAYAWYKGKLPSSSQTSNDDLLACLEAHKQAVDSANEKDKEIKSLKDSISKLTIDNQQISKDKEGLITRNKELILEVEEKEKLRAKWYGLYQQSEQNYNSCKTDRATFQKQLTECLNKQDFTVGELLVKLWNKVKGVKI